MIEKDYRDSKEKRVKEGVLQLHSTRLCEGTPSFEMVIPRGSEAREGTLEAYTAKTVYRKFEPNIPRNETARPQSQILHSC